MRYLVLLQCSLSLIITGCVRPTSDPVTHTVYNLANGYIGPVVIYYNQESDIIDNNDSLKVYSIPKNGVLNTSDKVSVEVTTQEFNYVKNDGSKMPIEYIYDWSSSVIKDDSIVCFGMESGTDKWKGEKRGFRTFIVGPKGKADSLFTARSFWLFELDNSGIPIR